MNMKWLLMMGHVECVFANLFHEQICLDHIYGRAALAVMTIHTGRTKERLEGNLIDIDAYYFRSL